MKPLKLHARIQTVGRQEPVIVRLAEAGALPSASEAVFVDRHAASSLGAGWGAVVAFDHLPESAVEDGKAVLAARFPADLGYLQSGDILRIHPQAGSVNVLYRKQSRFNAMLVTERCNSNCLMCSQPPKDVDDSFLVDDWITAVRLMDRATPEVGITGGEPTLLGERLCDLISTVRDELPQTALHMLSNGRSFSSASWAKQLADLRHPDFVVGIPLYSELPWRHDFVVQADGAFTETIRGLLNVARVGIRIELRVVLHAQTVERLPELCRFIARNLPFVEQVSLMGLEITGHTPMNLDALWIDPADYQTQLIDAVHVLDRAGIRTLIFNHQLCVIPQELWPFAVKAISDWKNAYLPQCDECTKQEDCGGFFSSGQFKASRKIAPILAGV